MQTSVPLFTSVGKDWFNILRPLGVPHAQAQLIDLIRDAPNENLSKDDFRDRIVLSLDVAKIPTSTLASATGIPAHYLEKYIIGSECAQVVRKIACEAIGRMDPATIPQFLSTEKTLRVIDKLSQLEHTERTTLLRKHLADCSFDWSVNEVFSKLVSYAIHTERFSEYTVAKEMGFTASFVAAWCQAKTLPLPVTRRRFLNVLHMATYAPLPRN